MSAPIELIEAPHETLRDGQAWQVMERIVGAGEPLATAYRLAVETLAYAENRAAS